MIPIVYIAGRFRHYVIEDCERVADTARMDMEWQDEAKWIRIIASEGFAWLAPLHNTVPAEGYISDDQFVRLDLEHIGLLRPQFDCILLRPGWDALRDGDARPEWYRAGAYEPSAGASKEYEKALERDLHFIHGNQGEDKVRAFLQERRAELTETET